MTDHTISKSQYVKGRQCPKALWLYRHRKDLAPEIDVETQARFDTGNEIGELAMHYFDGGVELSESDLPALWDNLTKYCKQDTYAMVVLLDVLEARN